ncbi:MAG TPA: BTAD domain-containing putative transcriptional regulator [Actinophytocola sp.]|uniref:AfsR/SARP family transcriptional regulator n=1 Tax=Actinophytocola sp. TaxID=1872138 RepID=UPI002DBCC857|nr:BTAD domain-containing putative transcriptional regulator [Actinophytocola sp.]HEU5473403.1 BTAD domain-containing putative transcriptional regulator [Actinophytocola sp.]
MGRQLVSVGGPRQRVTLALLALNANRVTSVDDLVDALWDSAPPSTARAQVQTCISALRKLFADHGGVAAIRTRPPGYLLEIAATELDSAEFAELVTAARDQADQRRLAEAAATLSRALALWRGPVLADIDSELVRRGAAAFEDGRLAAVEERVRLDLALGRHEDILGELAGLVEQHPLHERLARFRMIALYRSGRQADALETGRRTRTALVQELGIEPGQELRDLETAILTRDPALDLSGIKIPVQLSVRAGPAPRPAPAGERPVVPRQLPASIGDFTGRERLIAEIMTVLSGESDLATAYAVRIVTISGKGGVGKSSLAVRVAHQLGGVYPDGVLYGGLQHLSGTDDPTPKLLARFLRALGVGATTMPDNVPERAELYRSLLADKRLLVVLDDVSDEEQVLPLLPGSSTCAVIATSRVRLSGLLGAHSIDVDVFDTANSMELLAKIIGRKRVRVERDTAVELVNLCGGLPLALRIAGARLASRPHWRIAGLVRRLEDEASRLDELTVRGVGLRSNIDLTYRSLTAPAKRLFRLFAVIRSTDFPAWTAAALLDCDIGTAEDVLETLVDAQLLDAVEMPGEQVRYRFHRLIRICAMERLVETETLDERNQALARVLGGWLALAEHAHRQEFGGDYLVLHGTAPRWRPPGEAADLPESRPTEWWDAERDALLAAIRQAAAAGLDELCWDLALTAMTLFEIRGYYDHWRATAQTGLEVTVRAGNRTGRAAMLLSLGCLHLAQQRLTEAQRCLTEALDLFRAGGNVHGRALVLSNLAIVDGLLGRSPEMLSRYDEALTLMRAVGDRMGEAQVLAGVAGYRADEGDTGSAGQLLDEALAICREVGCRRGEAEVRHRVAHLHLDANQTDLAHRELDRVLVIVREVGDRIGEVHGLYGLGLVLHREGRLDSAETSLLLALGLARRLGERMKEAQALHLLGEIGLDRGDRTTGAELLGQARVLLAGLESKQATRLRTRLEKKMSAPAGDSGSGADCNMA